MGKLIPFGGSTHPAAGKHKRTFKTLGLTKNPRRAPKTSERIEFLIPRISRNSSPFPHPLHTLTVCLAFEGWNEKENVTLECQTVTAEELAALSTFQPSGAASSDPSNHSIITLYPYLVGKSFENAPNNRCLWEKCFPCSKVKVNLPKSTPTNPTGLSKHRPFVYICSRRFAFSPRLS
ncbi:hypothetical protein CEXT_783371 [Caerostris extrusa]|uniref:Uncharacterized protein n=1 Tax=Caerostris extrusa TaxID=172846 RepID=A0AAV4QWU1_CAEEX|nr:hypothetical protein CEXT_783371 [Caerostris extrusa]